MIVDQLIIGAGVSGLSASYHIGHENCVILEKEQKPFGHCASRERFGYDWDEGPHVSFTSSDYVRELIQMSVESEFTEFDARIGNYHYGCWVDHPAQLNLYQLSETIREACLSSFARSSGDVHDSRNYREWSENALGKEFAEQFTHRYTRKYWCVEPEMLSTGWLGPRVYRPSMQELEEGGRGKISVAKNYISTVRYPKRGGFESFLKFMADGARIHTNTVVDQIDLDRKQVVCSDSSVYEYRRLIVTIPLPVFIKKCRNVPLEILRAIEDLRHTSIKLINLVIPHSATRPEHWFYVYDHDKKSTRVTYVDKLKNGEGDADRSAVQVEVYFPGHQIPATDRLTEEVIDEMYELGVIKETTPKKDLLHFSHDVEWGNVTFSHEREAALDRIFSWLATKGMQREGGDLEYGLSNEEALNLDSSISLCGRYAQWKYLWSDDCILRGKQIAGQEHV